MNYEVKPVFWIIFTTLLCLGWSQAKPEPGAFVELGADMPASGLGFETFDFNITRLTPSVSCQ